MSAALGPYGSSGQTADSAALLEAAGQSLALWVWVWVQVSVARAEQWHSRMDKQPTVRDSQDVRQGFQVGWPCNAITTQR
jgi:hypothetical protein